MLIVLLASHLYYRVLHCLHPHSRRLSVILIGLLPRGRTKVRPIEVVIAAGVLLAVLLEGGLISSERGLSELERLLALLTGAVAELCRRLESLISLEAWLEVHPVLGSVAERLL